MLHESKSELEIRTLASYVKMVAKKLGLTPRQVLTLVLEVLSPRLPKPKRKNNPMSRAKIEDPEVDQKVQELREEVLEALSRLEQMDAEA